MKMLLYKNLTLVQILKTLQQYACNKILVYVLKIPVRNSESALLQKEYNLVPVVSII